VRRRDFGGGRSEAWRRWVRDEEKALEFEGGEGAGVLTTQEK